MVQKGFHFKLQPPKYLHTAFFVVHNMNITLKLLKRHCMDMTCERDRAPSVFVFFQLHLFISIQ